MSEIASETAQGIVPDMGDLTGQLEQAADGMLKNFLKDAGLFDMIANWGDKHMDEFKAKMGQWRKDVKDFITVDAQNNSIINRDALRQKLSVKEAMALLMDQLFVEKVTKVLFPKKSAYKTMSWEDSLAYYKEKNVLAANSEGEIDDKGNIVWPGEGPLGEINMVWSALKMRNETDKKETFPLPVPCRLIMPASGPSSEGPRMTPAKFSILKAYCQSIGVNLTQLVPGSSGDPAKAGDHEIQYVPVANGIPLKSDGKSVDMPLLEWYAKLWEKSADSGDTHGMWSGLNILVAMIKYYLFGGSTSAEDVLKAVLDMDPPPQATVDLFKTITPRGKEAPVVTSAETPTAVAATAPVAPAPATTPAAVPGHEDAPAKPAAEPKKDEPEKPSEPSKSVAPPAEPPSTPEKTVAQ